MDRLRKTRAPVRMLITKTANEIDAELGKAVPDLAELQARIKKLESLAATASEINQQLLDLLLDNESPAEEYSNEVEANEEYNDKIRLSFCKVERLLDKMRRPPSPAASEFSIGTGGEKKRNFKLPKIELNKFKGDLKEWLGFWSQFKKIDEDDTLHSSDKFQYLIQAMEPNSEARDIVTSYPQTEENYPKAVLALKERYGRENLLMQVYIRELLKLVINNATTQEKLPLNQMYVKLQSHLRALASINLQAQDPSAWLFPLVESSLPEELLRAWQRSPLSKQEGSKLDPPKSALDFLMDFIGAEVQSAQQIELAQSGFGEPSQAKKDNNKKHSHRSRNDFATASSLFTVDGKKTANKSCIFCGKENHLGQDCFKAAKMTMGEKKQKIQDGAGCFVCFKKGHSARFCRAPLRCTFCTKKHHFVMCPDAEKHKQEGQKEIENISEGVGNISIPTTTMSSSSQANNNKLVMMKTLHVRVSGSSGNWLEVRLLFDEGSQRSYVKTSIAEELKCPVVNLVTLQNQLFGGQMTEFKNRKDYKVKISSIQNKVTKELVLTNENVICSSCPTIINGPWIQELAKKKIYLTDTWSNSPEIQILIGSDLWGSLMTGRSYKLQNGLIAVESIFGWTLSGPVSVPQSNGSSYAATVISLMTSEDLSLKNLWSLETIGIKDSAEAISREDHDAKVKNDFQNSISRDLDGRYVVKLPWISKDISLPSNRAVCEKRLVSATSKLRSQKQYGNYDKIFQDWEKEGIIRTTTGNIQGDEHILPHRPVFKPESRTTPVRPVFDASCKVGNNPSLNQCLEKGPNLLELIPSILIRFRENKIGVSSDIRKAFQMLKVCEEDRRYQKFLWWEDPDGKVLKEYEHCRVVFGINSSPFMLAAVLEHHLKTVKPEFKEIAELVLKSMYVDNCLLSVNSEEEYDKFRRMSISILAEAKMELREWEFSQDSSSQKVTSVLGLRWDKEEDCLFCQVPSSIQDTEMKITKRSVLSQTAHVFDPIGFTCPAILTPKLLLQESWARELGWDEEWGPRESQLFQQWFQQLPDLARIKIPRCAFGLCAQDSIQLHTFTDASQKAYAAVVFVRVQCKNEVKIQLLQAKSRLAPLEKKNTNRVTIPRLELLGCLIGARLYKSVLESVSIKQEIPCYFWSDSTTALGWIRRDEDWGTFIGNRVRKINKLTPTRNWKHVPGHLNPADLPSRGCSPTELFESAWWEGPAWLREPEEHWPQQAENYDEDAISREIKKIQSITSVAVKVEQPTFSSYYKNVCVAAWIRRFYNNCRAKKEERLNRSVPTWSEMKQGELDLIYQVQKRNYPVKPELPRMDIVLKDDRLFHVKTRLQFREDTQDFRDPVLLPKDDPIVTQMVMYIHRSYCHAGTQFVLGKLREKYWIPSGRKTVGGIIRRCVNCRRFSTKSADCDPAPLPKARIETQFAFQTTGVDLAGPIYLKGKRKVWIVLYTCALYRGIYLDIVDSINTNDFLDSLEKFCCTIGRPSQLFSDNGTNFVGARNLMKTLQWDKIEKELHVRQIKWTMNPPTAAWWGGWWERLVRSIKDLMKRMLGKAKLTRLELENCLCSISYTINNRPLTTLTEDMDDLTPLTPAMFMKDSPVSGLPEREILSGRDMQDAYRKILSIKKMLRERFRKEYLSNLIQRKNEKKLPSMDVGDVVLVGADNKKRFEWPLGKILELIQGADGKVRVVKVRTAHGILTRPLQRIYPLEVSSPKVVPAQTQDPRPELPDPDEDDPVIVRKSRSGREYKLTSRYGQWNK